MNTSRVEAPVGVQAAEPAGESWISKTPGVCGGDACVRNTRIPIWLLEGWRRMGLDHREILAQYPGLTPEDLAKAWEYVAAHPEEIDQAIRENEEA